MTRHRGPHRKCDGAVAVSCAAAGHSRPETSAMGCPPAVVHRHERTRSIRSPPPFPKTALSFPHLRTAREHLLYEGRASWALCTCCGHEVPMFGKGARRLLCKQTVSDFVWRHFARFVHALAWALAVKARIDTRKGPGMFFFSVPSEEFPRPPPSKRSQSPSPSPKTPRTRSSSTATASLC